MISGKPLPLMAAIVLAAIVVLPIAAGGQELPIYGCRQAISCRNSPVAKSALNDPGTSGLLIRANVLGATGFHLVLPPVKAPSAQADGEVELHGFHLRNVTLFPTPAPPPPVSSSSSSPSKEPPAAPTPAPGSLPLL
jgi:hypothetical protein